METRNFSLGALCGRCETGAKPGRFAFSKRKLEAVQPPAKGRTQVYDTAVPGLALSVTSAGSRSYYLYKWGNGRPVRLFLAKFDELTVEQARGLAKEHVAGMARGKDPTVERRAWRGSPTVKDLFYQWWEVHSKRHKKTWRDDERIFKKYFGELAGRKITGLRKAHVQVWHARLGTERGRYQANRCRALLSAMWACAAEMGFDLPNPCRGVRKFKEESRERYLQPSEARAFFQSLAEEEPLWRDFFLTCIFSGARRGNVARMRWDELDLESGSWHLTGAQTKNGLPVVVVLPRPAVAVLSARRELTGESPWVFPSKEGSKSGYMVDPRKAWARVVKRAGLAGFRMHDMRRSLGSWQAAAGSSLQVIGRSLGHRDFKSTLVYSRLELDPVRSSVEKAVEAMRRAAGLVPDGTSTEGAADG